MFQAHRHVRSVVVAFTILAAVSVLSGCALPSSSPYAPEEPRLQTAVGAEDHEALAKEYELQASADEAASKRHAGYASIYRRNTSWKAAAHESLAKHCDEIARTYQTAAEQKLAMAKLHRALSGQTMRD